MIKFAAMKSGYLFLFCFTMSLLAMPSCKPKQKPLAGRYYTGVLFGKPYFIDAVGDSTDFTLQMDSIIAAFEQNFDGNNPGSVIARYNAYTRRDSVFVFNDSTRAFGMVYDLTKDLNYATMQYFDPTINPLKRAWMIARASGEPEPNLDSIYDFVGFDGAKMDLNEITDDSYNYVESQLRKTDPRIEADFTNVAAAMALDHIGDLLESRGIIQYRIKYGSDVLTYGAAIDSLNFVPIGVSDDSTDQYIRLVNMAFSTKRAQDKTLMIDPTYGYPVENEMAFVAVAAPTLAEACVFSEAFMSMGLEKASEYYTKNIESKIQSFMFYSDEKINNANPEEKSLHSASTEGFDRLMVHSDSPAVSE